MNDRPPLLFISHLTNDSQLAEAIQNTITNRLVGQLRVEDSFSFLGGRSGIVAENVDLIQALKDANAVLILHTNTEADWSEPLWECGVALNPEVPTKFIIFEFVGKSDFEFLDLFRVNIHQKAEIKYFVSQLLTDENFLPGLHRALTPYLRPESATITDIASELYDTIQSYIPQDRSIRKDPRYPYFSLRIPAEAVSKIKQINKDPIAEQKVPTILLDNANITLENRALNHFNYTAGRVQDGILFSLVYENWRKGADDSNKQTKVEDVEDMEIEKAEPHESTFPGWLTGLSLGIWRSIQLQNPRPISKAPLQSLSDNRWYHLLVTSIETLQSNDVVIEILMILAEAPVTA